MKKALSFFILFHFLSTSYACICSTSPWAQPIAKGWETSDIIFLGKASEIINASRVYDSDGQQQKVANFEIIEGYKNIEANQNLITLDYSENSCSVSFEEGKIYVVYGHRIPSGMVFTNQCTKTRELTEDFQESKEIHELRLISKEKDIKQPKLEQFIMVENSTLENLEKGNNQNMQQEATIKTMYWCLGLSLVFNLILGFMAIRKRNSTAANIE
ncbi:hypothetical protein [Hymenobacter sp. B1770]|uniref:hypothetical protein n=1 Tax=Hymenobacter sp. B1770 TaxID=1718788 RepID=UPI003CE8B607